MKKILGLTIAAVLILAIVGGGTWAYFSDTETGSISITASTLDLDVNGADTAQTIFSVTNKAPGDSDTTSYVTIKNSGSITGELDVSTSAATNTAGSGGTEYEAGSGELGASAEMAIFIDVDESGSWNTNDIGLKYDGTTYTNTGSVSLDYAVVNNYASKTWGGASGMGNMAAVAQDRVYVYWRIPSSAGNTIQGDSVSLTITFTLEQSAAD